MQAIISDVDYYRKEFYFDEALSNFDTEPNLKLVLHDNSILDAAYLIFQGTINKYAMIITDYAMIDEEHSNPYHYEQEHIENMGIHFIKWIQPKENASIYYPDFPIFSICLGGACAMALVE